MALSHSLIQILFDLRRRGDVGTGPQPTMLEFGEQNWFGDVPAEDIGFIIDNANLPEERRQPLHDELAQVLAKKEWSRNWQLARIFYKVIFNYSSYTAIDLHGTAEALPLDLNEPLKLDKQFDLITNIGTTEHVFNQYQAFKSIHELIRPGGMMLHSLPNQGCFDHGFFNYHPTFFYDLCLANRYEPLLMAYIDCSTSPHRIVPLASQTDYVRLAVEKKLTDYSGLMCVLRAPTAPEPFKIPRQGFYDNRLPPELQKAWRELPR